MKKSTIIGTLAVIVALGGIFWLARPKPPGEGGIAAIRSSGVLTVEEAQNYDFGRISMAAGTVRRVFKVRNTGAEAVTVNKMYTSCMCTTASLTLGGKRFGPYGMPGHGFIPKIGAAIGPNEEAEVEVVFDPAAHGPAGVGRIERVVALENNAGEPVELLIAATVIP